MKAPKTTPDLWAVCDPDGSLNHTTVSCDPSDAIKVHMDVEQTLRSVLLREVPPSWEQFEAEGYRVIRCDLVPQPVQPEEARDA